jgi:hypothetical protein
MMHALRTQREIDDAEASIRQALHDAIVDHDLKLERVARDLLAECDAAREALRHA